LLLHGGSGGCCGGAPLSPLSEPGREESALPRSLGGEGRVERIGLATMALHNPLVSKRPRVCGQRRAQLGPVTRPELASPRGRKLRTVG